MGEVPEFAVVVGVILTAALGWRRGNLWIQRLRGETAAELDELEERSSRVARLLESIVRTSRPGVPIRPLSDGALAEEDR